MSNALKLKHEKNSTFSSTDENTNLLHQLHYKTENMQNKI